MDINQQLEYLNLSADVLTEKDVLDTIKYDSTKIVSSKGIYEALQNLSASVSSDYSTKSKTNEMFQNLSNQLSDYQKAGDYISGNMLDVLATKSFVTGQHYLKEHQSLSGYYKKNETSSSVELSNKFDAVDADVGNRLHIDNFNAIISNYVLLSALEAAGFISSHQSLSDYYKRNETSSKYELINAFSKYYDVSKTYSKGQINGILRNFALLSDIYTRSQLENVLKNYALSNEVSSKEELAAEFDKCSKISVKVSSDLELRIEFEKYQKRGNYALSNEVSSKEELRNEFENYVKKNELGLSNYALKTSVSSKYELEREFEKYQKRGNYALSNEVSSKEELAAEFDKCSKISVKVSSDVELKEEFAKYQKKGNYALCTDISSKAELATAFAKCSKISVNVSSDAELSAEFAKYVKIDDSYKFALKNNVSTATQLSVKFSNVEKDILNRVKISGDSIIYGNLSIDGRIKANEICASFENIKNLDPKTAISTNIDVLNKKTDDRSTLHDICEKINESIIYYRLPIDLIDSGFSTSCEVSDITLKLNKISDIAKTSKLSNNIDSDHFISAINNDISILNNVTYTYNVEQSLSTLNNLTQSNKTYIKYVADIVNDILFNLDKFCTKNYTSSAVELSNQFNQYYIKNDIYNRTEIEDKLKKYSLSSTVYTKAQTNTILNKYALINELSSNYAKKNDLCAYALSSDVKRELLKKAFKDDVMSKAELSVKFNDIANEFDNTVHLDKKSTISADVNVIYNLGANKLSARMFNVDFNMVKNTNPIALISTLADAVDNNMSFGRIFNTLNNLILDSNLNIKLLDVKQSNPDNLDALLSTLNAVNDATKHSKLSDKSKLASYVENINNNVILLSNTISSNNLQQSLSCLGKKIQVVNNKTRYNSDVIIDLANELERGYSKNQTSSAYELRNAFNKFQPKGNYVNKAHLDEYAKSKWVNDNYVPLSGGVIINNLSVIDFTAKKFNVDFNYVIDKKEDNCLSAYLLFVQNPDILEIASKINEIVSYCNLNVELIRNFENIYNKIFNSTTEICRHANIKLPEIGATYFDIQNSLNVAITKIRISNGLSLQKIIQSQKYNSLLLIYYTQYLKTQIDKLSSDLCATNNDISYLSSSCNSLSTENIQLKNNVNGIRNLLSSFATDDVGENGIVKNANAVLSTLIINFGGSIHHISL